MCKKLSTMLQLLAWEQKRQAQLQFYVVILPTLLHVFLQFLQEIKIVTEQRRNILHYVNLCAMLLNRFSVAFYHCCRETKSIMESAVQRQGSDRSLWKHSSVITHYSLLAWWIKRTKILSKTGDCSTKTSRNRIE